MSSAPASDLRDKFLQGMSHAACTVNVVTTDGPAGRAGVTVSAMASVSADTEKPTLLVCVHHLSPAADKIVRNGVLCVNVLRDDQSYISDTFAGRFKDEIGDKFECAEWVNCPSGAPRLNDPLVAFDCALLSNERIGTHHIFLCAVNNLEVSQRGAPLIYANRAYGSPLRIDAASSLKGARNGASRLLKIGYFHTVGPYVIPGLIADMPNHDFRLIEGDQPNLTQALATGECDLAILYDIDLPQDLEAEELAALAPHVLLPQGHALASQTEIMPEELAGEPMVLLESNPSREYFPGLLRARGIEPQIAYRSHSFETVRGMVAHGLGYALLVTKPATAMSYDGLPLVYRPLGGGPQKSRLVLARRKGEALAPQVARFFQLCLQRFKES